MCLEPRPSHFGRSYHTSRHCPISDDPEICFGFRSVFGLGRVFAGLLTPNPGPKTFTVRRLRHTRRSKETRLTPLVTRPVGIQRQSTEEDRARGTIDSFTGQSGGDQHRGSRLVSREGGVPFTNEEEEWGTPRPCNRPE